MRSSVVSNNYNTAVIVFLLVAFLLVIIVAVRCGTPNGGWWGNCFAAQRRKIVCIQLVDATVVAAAIGTTAVTVLSPAADKRDTARLNKRWLLMRRSSRGM